MPQARLAVLAGAGHAVGEIKEDDALGEARGGAGLRAQQAKGGDGQGRGRRAWSSARRVRPATGEDPGGAGCGDV
ncbi:MAG: hypothetical protein IPN01_28635 [Deltaproteobacteria bacterium]|nr:hypothetical protein [Deltaproteobacteria bacterium]